MFHSLVGSGTGGHPYPSRDRHSRGMLKAIAPTATLSCGGTLQRSACTVVGGAANPCMCKKAFDQLCLCQSLSCTYGHWPSPAQICLSRCQQCGQIQQRTSYCWTSGRDSGGSQNVAGREGKAECSSCKFCILKIAGSSSPHISVCSMGDSVQLGG